jgi:hypothetical protein
MQGSQKLYDESVTCVRRVGLLGTAAETNIWGIRIDFRGS